MFGKLYKGELKKLVRPGAMIALCVVLALVILIYAVLSNIISETLNYMDTAIYEEEYIDGTFILDDEDYYKYTPEEISEAIAQTEQNIQDMEKEADEDSFGYTYYSSIFSAKARLTALKYIRKYKLYDTPVHFLGVNYNLDSTTAETFTANYMSIAAAILLIYGIVIGAGLLADEYKSGTIKLLLSRPITKNQLVTAKLLAALTVMLGLFSVFSLIAYIYGAIAFSTNPTEALYLVFNAQSVIRSTIGAYTFAQYLSYAIEMTAYLLLAYFFGTLIRKKTPAIIIGILISLGTISGVLALTPVQIAAFSVNTNMLTYFTASASVPAYGNFYLSLGVFIVYMALITFGLYFTVNKRDVI